jgi:rare lipoprotein A
MGGGRLLLLLVLLLLLLTWGCASPGRERPVSATDHGERGGKRIERGFASWYGDEFHGRPTASGEIFDMHGISAAHRTLPFGTVVEVTNLNNGRRLDVRINDRGPFVRGRILDLSKAAAAQLDMVVAGIARVELRIVDRPAAARRRAAAVEVVLVQAGAFLEKARARALAERLYHVDRRFRVYSTGGWHRVQARGLDLEQAEELRRRLTTAGVEAVVAAER